jgi:fructose-1,6-bisphosphatase
MLVLTVGRGVHGFTLDRGFGEFILTHPNMRFPKESSESSPSMRRTSASGSRR